MWSRYCDEPNCEFEALVAASGSSKPILNIKPADSVEALQTLQANSLKTLSKQSSQNSSHSMKLVPFASPAALVSFDCVQLKENTQTGLAAFNIGLAAPQITIRHLYTCIIEP